MDQESIFAIVEFGLNVRNLERLSEGYLTFIFHLHSVLRAGRYLSIRGNLGQFTDRSVAPVDAGALCFGIQSKR